MKLVKEHINFERGLDPKDAMDTGAVSWRKYSKLVDKLIKPGIVYKIEPHFGYIFYFFRHPENNQIYFTINPSDINVAVRLNVNNFPEWIADDEDEPLFFQKTKKDLLRFISSIKLNESHHFQRGLDPKDAMHTGDVEFRKREKIKEELRRAIKILVYDLGVKKESVIENDGKGFDIQFNGKYMTFGKLRDCVYYIGYYFNNNINPYYAGFEMYKNLPGPVEPEASETNHYGSVAECIYRIRVWTGEIDDFLSYYIGDDRITKKEAKEKFNESINFERGLDPKDAMQTGDVRGRKVKKVKRIIFEMLDKLSKKYPLVDITEDVIYPEPYNDTLVSFKHSYTRYFIYNSLHPNIETGWRVGFWFHQGNKMNWFTDEEANTISACTNELENWFKTLEIP